MSSAANTSLGPDDGAGPPAAPSVHQALQQLRARAEKRRSLVTEATEHRTPEVMQRLVQELQVYQIELEMQYEELLLAQDEAQTARAELTDLYDFAPVGYFTLSATGLIDRLNLCAARQLGSVRQRLAGRRFALFVAPANRPEFGQFLARVLTAPHTHTAELLLQREDGSTFHARIEGLRVEPGANLPAPQCRLAVLDVSAHHQATAELAASEARFRRLFAESADAVVLVQAGRYADCNAAALRLLGLAHKAELVGQPTTAFVPERQPGGALTADLFRQYTAQALRLGSMRGEALMRRATGEEIWVNAVLTPVEMHGASPMVHIVWRDVTAERAAHAQLRESQSRLSMALEASQTGIFTWDLTTNLIEWDQRAQAVCGRAFQPGPVPVEVLGNAFHPDDAARVWAATQAAVASGAPLALDYRVRWPDGSEHYVSMAGQTVPDAQGQVQSFIGVLRDISELRQSQEQLQAALAASTTGVWSIDFATGLVHGDARTLAIFGLPADTPDLTLEGLRALVHPHDLAFVDESLQQAIASRAGFELEHRMVWPDGSVHYVAAQAKLSFDNQNRPLRLTGLMRDVTPRRRAEEDLRHAKEFSDSLLQHSIDGIVAFDLEGRVTAWNSEAVLSTGRAAAAVLGRSVFELFPAFDTPATHQSVEQVLAGEQVALLGQAFRHREGRYDAFLVPLKDHDQAVTGVLGIIRDVTERDRLAAEALDLRLRQQQEVLAAILETQEAERKRIAEALHNGLGQVLYAAKLSLEKAGLAVPPAPRDTLKLLNEAIHTTRTISFELTPGILEDFGLRVALEELVKRLKLSGVQVSLSVELPPGRLLPAVEIAVYRIVQELMNNVLKHAEATEMNVYVVAELQHLEVTVEDNGRGISSAVPAGAPLAGIGLAGVRNRVNLLGGTFTLASRPGRGTIASVELAV